MGWCVEMYIAVLLYEALSESADLQPLYREDFVLIMATSEEEAGSRAASHGRGQETSYKNELGEVIRWSLKAVVDVAAVFDDISEGGEIYARHFSDYDSYHRVAVDPDL